MYVCISWTNKGFNTTNMHGATTKIHEDPRRLTDFVLVAYKTQILINNVCFPLTTKFL